VRCETTSRSRVEAQHTHPLPNSARGKGQPIHRFAPPLDVNIDRFALLTGWEGAANKTNTPDGHMGLLVLEQLGPRFEHHAEWPFGDSPA
jgi:hypothetical protein